jgi:hypothetical protein
MMKRNAAASSTSSKAGSQSRTRLPPSPERETVYEGAKYVRAYSASLVRIDGKEYSFEEIRAARHGYVEHASIDQRDAEAIKNREYTRRRWRESELEKQRQSAQMAEERRQLEEQRRSMEEMKREIEETKRRLDEQVRTAALVEEEARRARLLRPREEEQEQGPSRGERVTREDERQKKRVRLEDDDEVAEERPFNDHYASQAAQPVRQVPPSGRTRPPAAVEASTPAQDRFRPSLATAKPAPRTPTMTFHTKRALDKVLPLFGDGGDDAAQRDETTSLTAALRGDLLQDARGSGGSRHADAPPTPTVTMNTKAAMANVLSMFSGDFDDDTRGLGDATLSSIPIEDRENAAPRPRSGRTNAAKIAQTPGVAPRKGLGLAVAKTKKTNREVLQEELAKENRQAAANVPHGAPHNKRTFGDAVREVIAASAHEPDELTGNLSWDDTGLLPAGALAQAYRPLATSCLPPEHRRLVCLDADLSLSLSLHTYAQPVRWWIPHLRGPRRARLAHPPETG